jgi:ankyrin repeat protein
MPTLSEPWSVRLCRPFAVVALGLACALPARADLLEDFIIAVNNDRVATVRELLAKGIDPDSVGSSGEPVLVMAARHNFSAVVEALLAAKANVNAKSTFGDTAIMAAAFGGHLDLVKTLRTRGAGIDGPGWTPLIYAAAGGHDAIVTYLLGEGADINAASPNGTTALMMAAREGKGPTATLLLAKGADVNRRNENGVTALAWALRNNERAMADALRKAGATE